MQPVLPFHLRTKSSATKGTGSFMCLTGLLASKLLPNATLYQVSQIWSRQPVTIW